MHVLSRSAMRLQMRLLTLVVILLCHRGVSGQSSSCQLAQGTTPIWSTAERCSRGIALLAVQWRRSLVADDQGNENATQESFTASLGAPLSTQTGMHSNSSIDASAAGAYANEVLSNASWNYSERITEPSITVNAKNDTGISGGRESVWQMSQSDQNVSANPLGKDQFEPFGYPGAGLLLELHMPQVTLRELHSSSHGSLAAFLLELRGELSKAADVEEPRISILGIYGRFKRLDGEGFLGTAAQHVGRQASSPPMTTHVDEEVIVRFEVLPGYGNDAEPREVLDILRNELRRSSSGLSSGPLGSKLDNATLTLSAPVGLGSLPRAQEQRGMAHMSAMAWPIGISAAFIGVLIWLAAY